MPSTRSRFALTLLVLSVALVFKAKADESTSEPETDPRVALYERLSVLSQARIRAYCGVFAGGEEGEGQTCLGNTLSTLLQANSRKDELTNNERSQPDNVVFWNEVSQLAQDILSTIPFHPLCIDQLPITPLGPSDPGGQCDVYDSPIVVRESGWFLSAYPEDEEGNSMGWAAYHVVQQTELNGEDGTENGGTNLWIEATLNTGGTGHFDNILEIHLPADQSVDRPHIELVQQIGGGDRCNDGKSAIAKITPRTITYSHAATPYRLLNPGNEENTYLDYIISMLEKEEAESGDSAEASELAQMRSSNSPETFMGWRAYDDVVSCAICCVGSMIKTVDLDSGETWLEGVIVDTEFPDVAFFAEPALAECAEPWLQSLEARVADQGAISFSPDEWLIKRDELIEACQDVQP